jgi:hypothetical protein
VRILIILHSTVVKNKLKLFGRSLIFSVANCSVKKPVWGSVEGILTLRKKEQNRLRTLNEVEKEKIVNQEAVKALGI